MQQLLKRLQRHHASFIRSCSSSGGSSSRGYHMEQQQQQQMRPTKKVSLEITRSRDDASADWRAKPLVGRYRMFRRCCSCPCCCLLLLPPAAAPCCCPCSCSLLLSPAATHHGSSIPVVILISFCILHDSCVSLA